jgi:hypothetical protein
MKQPLIIKIVLFALLGLTLAMIGYVIQRGAPVIDLSTSVLSLVGAGIGFLLSLLLKNLTSKKIKPRVFLSYNINDTDFARRLIKDLETNSITIYNENEIADPGEAIDDNITKHIRASDTLIVILSRNTMKTRFLKKEIEIAKESKKTIIPLLMDDIEIPSFLNNLKAADFRVNYKDSLHELLASIKV